MYPQVLILFIHQRACPKYSSARTRARSSAAFSSCRFASKSSAFSSAPTITPVPRVQHLPPAVVGGPVTRVELTAFDISAVGTFIGVTVAPQASPADGPLLGQPLVWPE